MIALSDDPLLQNKLKENIELAEAATRALEHVYEEEPPPPPPPPPPQPAVVEGEQPSSPSSHSEAIQATASDDVSNAPNNRTGISSSPTTPNENQPAASPTSAAVPTSHADGLSNSTIPPPPPPPPPPSSSAAGTTLPSTKAPAASVATTIPLAHSAAAIQAAYRQQTGLLGALPNTGAVRAMPGAVYATTAGLANGLTGQIVYGGKKQFRSKKVNLSLYQVFH